MMPPIQYLFPSELGTEIIYSFIIILSSLMIFFSTKEIYKLSSYKGLKYFRYAFLFFAIAYFLRYSTIFLLKFLNKFQAIRIPPRSILTLSLFLFMYFSSMAIFYLLYSVMWKKWGPDSKIIIFNMISLIIATIGISFRGIMGSLIINIIFFISTAIILLLAKRKNDKNGLFVVYLLLFAFFFLNIINTLIPEFLQMYKIIIYLVSIFLFMTILYKVLRKVGN